MSEYVRLRRLADGKSGVKASLEGMVSSLGATKEKGKIQLSLVSGDDRKHWSIDLSGKEGRIAQAASKSPELEVVMSEETWLQIASGEVPPHEAYGRGMISVRGDLELGRRLFAHLRESSDKPKGR
jgi:putative sterol carrier protein